MSEPDRIFIDTTGTPYWYEDDPADGQTEEYLRAALLSEAPTVTIDEDGYVRLPKDYARLFQCYPGRYKLVAVPVEEET